jgi:hypothetical protein
MKATKEQIARWEKDALTAYNTKAYNGSFDLYWEITSVLRTDETIDWDDVREIKLKVWESQES